MIYKYKGRDKHNKVVTGIREGKSRKDIIYELKREGICIIKLDDNFEEGKSGGNIINKIFGGNKKYDKKKTKKNSFISININGNTSNIGNQQQVGIGGALGMIGGAIATNIANGKGGKQQIASTGTQVGGNPIQEAKNKKKRQPHIYEVDVDKITDDDFLKNFDEKQEESVLPKKVQEPNKDENILNRDITFDSIKSFMTREKPNRSGNKVMRMRKVKKKDVMMFTKQFATLLETGIPIVKALQLMIQQTSHGHFKKVLAVITKDVSQGYSLSFSMGRFYNIFDDYYVTTVQTGEATGELPETLNLLYDYLFNKQKLRSKIISSSIYPILIFSVLIIGLIVASIVVIPKFTEMFAGIPLPKFTQVVFGTMGFIGHNILFIIIAIIGLIIGFKLLLRNPYIKYTVSLFLIKTPMVGKITKI